jgi:L-aspartate oxidase
VSGKEHRKVLIIGTGFAGLSSALELAEEGIPVTLVTKAEDPSSNNSSWAQGGIIFRDPEKEEDPEELLIQDIQNAGDGVCYLIAIQQLVQLGQKLVQEKLIDEYNIPFDCNGNKELLRGREGAHSRPRIIHVGDSIGKAIMSTYLKIALEHPNIEILTNRTAVDLLTTHHHCVGLNYQYTMDNVCCGAYLLNNKTGDVETVTADYTILATGGVGNLFLHSTNSPGSIGAGMVMASRADARILFSHYIQFHPTAFWKGKRRFLISEAVRGTGAQLLNSAGERFMQKYAPELMELAPRDVVTRAIIQEMISREEDYVHLDLSTHDKKEGPVEERFPTIFKECLSQGVDIRKEPIPVVPAAHYQCGGIQVDLNGQTTLPRLFAAGEVACTGVHGANRLASTSLLECLTWGVTAGRRIKKLLKEDGGISSDMIKAVRDWKNPGHRDNVDKQRLSGDWSRIRSVMWNYVGIIRSKELLDIAYRDFRLLNESLQELYHKTPMSSELVDLFHGVLACRLIVESARKDSKSRGCHYLVK